MDLPTYTNIWRIEKRLYKLYDFRLPMPLPVGQIAVFTAIAVPYVVILKLVGLPFDHTLLWLYILPPGMLAWLVTRPVLEGKRLPELVVSQLRYLNEPRTWCRMAPFAERDEIAVVARVWRRADAAVADDTPARAVPAPPARDVPDGAAAPEAPLASPPRPRPLVTVTGDQPGERPIRTVERALGNPSERRTAGWHDHVVVVPGGHRPGRPDQLQRDRARARLPIPAGRRVVVLGCTVGAGQTVTTLLTGELLASLRDDAVAVLDLNPGRGSLAERAQAVPALTGSGPPAPSRLEVITREAAAAGEADEEDVTKIFELLSARYPLTLADPGAAAVPRVLAAASQLILVAPASQDAASALATTREWLEAHGHAQLADDAITVMNGVSRHTMPHVEHAEALARGRCRAIVRVPWDDHLKDREPERVAPPAPGAPAPGAPVPGAPVPGPVAGSLSPAALHAYTALAGVLVTALAGAPEQLRARP